MIQAAKSASAHLRAAGEHSSSAGNYQLVKSYAAGSRGIEPREDVDPQLEPLYAGKSNASNVSSESKASVTKTARHELTRSYRQRLKRRLNAALLEARSSANSLACAQAIRDQPSPVDTAAVLRRNVVECRRL